MSSFRSWNTMYFFAVGITFTSFMLRWGLFHLSSGMIYFFLFQYVSVYIMDLLLKRYRKSVSPRRKSSPKDFLDHRTSRMEKVFDILHSPSLYHGELIWCHCHGWYGFYPFGLYGWCSRIKWWTLWPRKWWMKCLSICQVRTTILVISVSGVWEYGDRCIGQSQCL